MKSYFIPILYLFTNVSFFVRRLKCSFMYDKILTTKSRTKRKISVGGITRSRFGVCFRHSSVYQL